MEVDIITYDPSVATEVRFNRKQYRLAADRGIYFELSYSSMLRDSSLRKKMIYMSHLYHAIGKSKVCSETLLSTKLQFNFNQVLN